MSLVEDAGTTAEGTTATTSTEATTQQPPATQQSSSEATPPADGANVWYYDEGKPGEGERPEWLNPKYKNTVEQAKGYAEAQKKLGAMKGAPDEYDLSVAEMPDVSFTKDDPLMAEFLDSAKKNNVSQEYVSELLKTYVNMAKANQPDPQKELEKLGVNAKQDIQVLAQWGDNNLSKEESQLFKNMMTTADSVRLFEKIRGISSRADTAPGNPKTPRETKEQVLRMMHDPQYDVDESYRDLVREKLAQFGG